MKNTGVQTSATSNTRKEKTVTHLTYQDVLKLLDVKEIPGTQENKDFSVEVLNIALQEEGLDWIKKNRNILVKEMEIMPSLM